MSSSDIYKYEYKENKYFIKYAKERDVIKEKYIGLINYTPKCGPPKGRTYPPYTEKERNRYREYLKEMGDLLFKTNGNFQKFIWDDMSEVEKLAQEKKCRRRINDSQYE
tara:strand:+ start:346 stop:672 length:327 start_codon:yes stop_codon:yes gene_type:complete